MFSTTGPEMNNATSAITISPITTNTTSASLSIFTAIHSSPTSGHFTITTNSIHSSSIFSSGSVSWSDWSTVVAAAENETSSSSHFFDASCHGTKSEDARIDRSIQVFFFSSLIFVVLGLVGNLLSIAVFSSKDMQSMSSNVYLLTLASSDSLYLLSVFLFRSLTIIRCWYFPDATFDVVNRSSFFCVVLQYLCDLFSDYSTCLILLFTVERVVAVFRPIRFKELFSVTRARLSCLALFLFIATSIAPYHALYMDVFREYNVCTVRADYEDIFTILYVVEICLFRAIPVLLIAILNVLIIVRVTRLTKAKAKRRQLIISSSSSCREGVNAGQGLTSTITPSTSASCGRPSTSSSAVCASSKKKRRMSKGEERNFQLTVILILVSSSYVLLYIPVLVHFLLHKLHLSLILSASIDPSSLTVFGNYSRALYVSGFAINFFLYTVSGRVFRDQLTALVCPLCLIRGRKKGATPWTQTTSAHAEASSAF